MQVVPNQLVELHLQDFQGPQVFRTRVEDAYDDLLVVGAPLQQGQLVPVPVGTRLTVEFKLRDVIQKGRFRNQAILEKRFRTNIPLLQLKLLGPWEKTQERMFLRVPVLIDTIFVFDLENGRESPAHSGLILDLSGGGFLLRSSHAFKIGDEVRVSFDLDQEQIVAKATVARFVLTDSGHDFGCAFEDLSDKIRQTIIKYVFKRQIYLREIARGDRA